MSESEWLFGSWIFSMLAGFLFAADHAFPVGLVKVARVTSTAVARGLKRATGRHARLLAISFAVSAAGVAGYVGGYRSALVDIRTELGSPCGVEPGVYCNRSYVVAPSGWATTQRCGYGPGRPAYGLVYPDDTSVTVTTDGSGDAEIVLSGGAIDGAHRTTAPKNWARVYPLPMAPQDTATFNAEDWTWRCEPEPGVQRCVEYAKEASSVTRQ